MAGFALSLFTLCPLALGSAAETDDAHPARAARWFERAGLEEVEGVSLEEVVRSSFVPLELGLFEVLVPAGRLADDDWLDPLKEVSLGLIDAQLEWIEWLPASDDSAPPPRSLANDVKLLKKWIGSWKAKDLAAIRARDASSADSEPVDLFAITGASDKVRTASANLATYMRAGGPLGPHESSASARMILLPEREDFVEYLAVVGLLEPRHRPFFWIAGCELWTEFDYDGTRALALEYATPDAHQDYRRSTSMRSRNPKALVEHVTHLATRSLLESSFREGMEPMLAAGIANDLVITLYGEADTRTDGDLRSRATQARSVFIPGGNPNGGTLPATDANSRWRAQKGAGWFVEELRRAQEDGAKKVKEKWQEDASFVLRSDAGQPLLVHAPFLGPGATFVPDSEYQGDYAEFLRAYRACFLHWLRVDGGGKHKASRARYSELLRGIAAGDRPLPEVFGEVYGAPLSAPTGPELFPRKGGPLEGRFLTWLAKQ